MTFEDLQAISKARTRFLLKCKIVGECWEWTGAQRGRYGIARLGGHIRNAHRVSWALFRCQIAEGISVLHTCGNPKCCNPSHLKLEVQELPLNPAQASNAA